MTPPCMMGQTEATCLAWRTSSASWNRCGTRTSRPCSGPPEPLPLHCRQGPLF
uniref:Alternative protein IP6K1 n=1 Tax=Homo sapiens TaxID=9606 RepID=L8EAR7_HUMAN|nr:alternative protein IP6K1 [Homo sapiens]